MFKNYFGKFAHRRDITSFIRMLIIKLWVKPWQSNANKILPWYFLFITTKYYVTQSPHTSVHYDRCMPYVSTAVIEAACVRAYFLDLWCYCTSVFGPINRSRLLIVGYNGVLPVFRRFSCSAWKRKLWFVYIVQSK